jgi:F420-non-reducing hydrogenase large subunit
MMTTLGGKPVHFTLAYHWARVIELVNAAEMAYALARDPEITNPNIRTVPTETPDEGVGVVEAPRGTLYHHYKTDEKGILTAVNLIVGTTNNYAAINLSIKKAAQNLLEKSAEISDGVLNMIEMAFRAYDPCFGCATHTLPGQMPLEVTLRDGRGEIIAHRLRD